jgi:MYXO-CTERM domain-containing protein
VTPSAEVCDGCDNDCDGFTDNGLSVSIPCGFTGPGEPAYCQGTITCKAPQAVPPGTCSANGGFTACQFTGTPQAETCNNLDDDCNGIIDDGVPSVDCIPSNAPPGLVYQDTNPNSQCKKGKTQCVNGATVCVGWVGPSAEVCDGVDNNCDGTVDNGVSGVGLPCGKSQAPCTPGITACVNGALACTGGTQPSPEICDGIDNDCNGAIDDGVLADAPAAGMNGCWDLPTGNCPTPCQFPATNPKLFWCAPTGATCNDNGTLAAPCNHGSLACVSGAWTCKGPKKPETEVCDGVDNDCNGTVDDGVMNVGTVCGTNIGECKQGVLQCSGGVLSCVGGVFPTQEVCDGKDNDCDGVIDNGIVTGGTCTVQYDTTLYPGDRTHGACKPGIAQCDGNGGVVCVGGVGPTPEVCDGIDNDCDGQIDEVGNAPDGINGSANPLPPPGGNIGDACGVNQGECTQGAYACLNGQFTCIGGKGAQPEECDCKDNDCDGVIDNQTPNGPPLCGTGKDCIKSGFGCGCAAPCDLTKEFPCPGGQVCQDVMDPNGNPKGKYCVSDPCPGGCASKTVKDANGKVICAPAGTAADPATCVTPPVCVCNGQAGCKNPCAGVSCTAGSVCTDYGPNAGKCVTDNCFANPCLGCGKVCNLGSCVPNPCEPNPCKADEECKPSADFTTQTCVPTCAGVDCPAGKQCVAGACVDGCSAPCPNGQACDLSQSPPTCVGTKCNPNPCTDGSFCDPVTGACGNDPCAGVVCPMGQVCQGGSCFAGQGGAGGGSSTSSSGTASTSSGGNTGGGGGGGVGGNNSKGIWGLATGGGGCSCEVGPGATSRLTDGRWALVALALVLGARRKRSRRAGEEVSR